MIFKDMLLLTAFVSAVMAIMNIIGASVYEVTQTKQRLQQKLHPYVRRYRLRPLVSVIVFAHSRTPVIEGCLDSVLQSSYRKLEIIVVDIDSCDTTRQLVRQYATGHPKKSIRLYAKRRQTSQLDALTYAYKKYVNGELVVLLDTSHRVSKHALSQAAVHFQVDPRLGVLNPHFTVRARYSTVGLFQKFEQLLKYRSKKFNSAFNAEYVASSEGAIYTTAILGRLLRLGARRAGTHTRLGLPMLQLGNKDVRSSYASDVVIYHAPAASFRALFQQRYSVQRSRLLALMQSRRLFFTRDLSYSKFLTWFRLPFALVVGITALFIPVLATYFLYLAVSLHQPALLLAACLVVSVLVASAIWGDDQLGLRQKLAYCMLIPITYGWFFLLSFVSYLVILVSFLQIVWPALRERSFRAPA